MIRRVMLFLVCVCALMVASSAVASPNLETWDADTSGWLIKDWDGGTVYGSLDWVSSLGGYSGVLRDTGGVADTNPREDLIYTTSGGLAFDVGTYGGFFVKFDFYAEGQAPQKLDIYFQTSGGDSWYLDVTPQIADTAWTSVEEGLNLAEGWYNVDGNPDSQFRSDLQDISEIGVLVYYRDNVGGQVYGLDNFDVIPEPSTWAFLGIAFLSVGYSFRDRLDKAATAVKVWLKG